MQMKSYSKSNSKKRLPVQNKKLKDIFGVPSKNTKIELQPVAASTSISKFLNGIQVSKQNQEDPKRSSGVDTPKFTKLSSLASSAGDIKKSIQHFHSRNKSQSAQNSVGTNNVK